MPSPTCTIGGGSTPASIAANSTINGVLVSGAGANYWFLTILACDDNTVLATLLASLSINQVAKTFSFTSGGTPSALILQSTVGVGSGSKQGTGTDINNVPQPSYTTTFKCYVPTASGNIVMCPNEAFEQDPVNGWSKIYNLLVRSKG
jgi:hypothetical protein